MEFDFGNLVDSAMEEVGKEVTKKALTRFWALFQWWAHWPGEPNRHEDVPPASNEEFLAILRLRAAAVEKHLQAAGNYAGGTEFMRLHRKHLKATKSNQQFLAHEIRGQISDLLSRQNPQRPPLYQQG